MRSLRDFLDPIWRYTPNDSDFESEQTELNQVVLDMIDEQLNKTEDETIASKAQSFLKTASDEWLDFWGSWFGLRRDKEQNDDEYREALIYHVKHARDTIPAMREAMSRYLHTNIENVHIKEPFWDVFILNDSNLNSEKRLYSWDYYREALMDIIISVPFPPELIDIINWFRPAGVLWVLTYAPGEGIDAPEWHFPPYDAHQADQILTIDYLTGLTEHLNLNLTPATKFSAELFNQPFILNDSLLNDIYLLVGGAIFERNYYNYVGSLNGLLMPKATDTAEALAEQIDVIPTTANELLAAKDEDTYAFRVSDKIKSINNLLNDTYTFNNWAGYIGIEFNNIHFADDAQVCTIATPKSVLMSSNQPTLQKGMNYTLSAQVRLEKPVTDNNIQLYASVDNNNSKLLVSSGLNEHWSTQSISFVYTGSVVNNVEFWVEGDLSRAVSVQIAHVKLEEGLKATPWCKSPADYTVALEPDYTYVYGIFNYREFVYDRALSEGYIRGQLGEGKDTPQAINKYISDYLERKTLSLEYFANNISDADTNVELMIFSFNLGIWVNFKDTPLNQGKVDITWTFKDISPYLNNEGVFVLALRAKTKDVDYSLFLNDICLGMDKMRDGYAFKIFGTEIYMWETLTTTGFINTTAEGNPEDEVLKPDLYDRYQQYYPVRYIRNYIKGIHPADPKNMVTSKELNDQDDEAEEQATSFTFPTSDYSPNLIEPIYNPNDPSLPVISLSLLGAYNGDLENKNMLGDLLPNGVYTDELRHPWEKTNDSIQTSNSVYKGRVLGMTIANMNSYATNAGIKIESKHIFSETKYRFEFLAKSNTTDLTQLNIQVYLKTNAYRYLATSHYVTLTDAYQWFNIDFDTDTVFPDGVEIYVYGSDRTTFSFSFVREALRINAQLKIDGSVPTRQRVPGIYPTSYPMLFQDLKTANEKMEGLGQGKTIFSDLRSKVSYDDIEFNTDDNALYFDSGITDHPLRYGDKEAEEITYNDLLTKDEASLPNFQKVVQKTSDMPDTEALHLLTYLQSYVYHIQALDSNTAYTFQEVLNEGITYQGSKMLPYNYPEHSITIDLGSVHTDIRDITLHHGSDSLINIEYDTCLQTSVDGEHWVTWYDNYRGDKDPLDDRYVEGVGTPRRFRLPIYNTLQPNIDIYGDLISNVGSRPETKFKDLKFPFSQLRIPNVIQWEDFRAIRRLSDYDAATLFEDLGKFSDLIHPRHLVWSDLLGWHQAVKDRSDLHLMSAVGTRYPAFEASNLILGTKESSQKKVVINSQDLGKDCITTFQPVNAKDLLGLPQLLTAQTRSTNVIVPNEPVPPFDESQAAYSNIFISNKSDLNSDKILVDGVFVPYIDKDKYPNVPPENHDPIYHIEQHLVQVDIVKLVTEKYPDIWKSLGYTSSASDTAKKAAMIRENLVGYPHEIAFSVYVTATSKFRDWNVSLWNTKTSKWDLSQFNGNTGQGMIILNSEEIIHYLDDRGKISVIICQTVSDLIQGQALQLDRFDYTLVLFPKLLDKYLGGLYPHYNYAINTAAPRKVLGTGVHDETKALYELYPEIMGNKVCISFNVLTDAEPTGWLSIRGVNMTLPAKVIHLLEPYAQHFSFVMQLPDMDHVHGKPIIALELHYCNADVTVSSFKVEKGTEESPFVVSYLDTNE